MADSISITDFLALSEEEKVAVLAELPAEARYALQQLIGSTYSSEEKRQIREANTADAETRTAIYASAVPFLAKTHALKAVKVVLRDVAEVLEAEAADFADDAKRQNVGQPFRMSDSQKKVVKSVFGKVAGAGKNEKTIVKGDYHDTIADAIYSAVYRVAEMLLADGMSTAAVAADDDDD